MLLHGVEPSITTVVANALQKLNVRTIIAIADAHPVRIRKPTVIRIFRLDGKEMVWVASVTGGPSGRLSSSPHPSPFESERLGIENLHHWLASVLRDSALRFTDRGDAARLIELESTLRASSIIQTLPALIATQQA